MKVEAHAKVNLSLEVYGVRSDGYHELKSVVAPISLSDTLSFEPAESFSTDTGYADDLILKATSTLSASTGLSDLPAYRIAVEKRIPAGGGLGGGSADAAATLLALNDLWKLGRTPAELAEIGAGVGSDVPALVLANHHRRSVLMEGRGERVSLLPESERRTLVLASPGVPSSTAEVYARCGERLTPAVEPVNDLESAAVGLHPEIGVLLSEMRNAGASGVMMSGSGSVCLGFAADDSSGSAIAERLRSRGYRCWLAETLH